MDEEVKEAVAITKEFMKTGKVREDIDKDMVKVKDADETENADADEILAKFNEITKEAEDEEALKGLDDILKLAGPASEKLEKINKILSRETKDKQTDKAAPVEGDKQKDKVAPAKANKQ